MSFNQDKQIGESVENEFADMLVGVYEEISITSGYSPDFDVIGYKEIGDIRIEYTYEVKYQKLHSKTGNLAVEYMYKDEVSGIAKTKATYWVETTDEYFYILKTSDFKDWIKSNWKYLKKTSGGDNNLSRLILIPEKTITNFNFLQIIKRK